MIKKQNGLILNLLALSFCLMLIACSDKNAETSRGADKDNKVKAVVLPEGCGPARIEELKTSCKKIPKWLLEASVRYETVSISSKGEVTWNDGVWHNGTWEYGTWHNGNWEYGTWHDGVWHEGVWENGTWLGGTWYNGTWHNGAWYSGIWKGEVKGSDFDPTTAE